MSFKLTSGRKRDIDVWQYFSYDAIPNKSKCSVIVEGKSCGRQVSAKNATNLLNHLRYNHPDVQKKIIELESAKKSATEVKAKLGTKARQTSPFCPAIGLQINLQCQPV